MQALTYNATLDKVNVEALNPVERGDATTTLAKAEKIFTSAPRDRPRHR
jgi:hypothetical protein